MKAKLAALAVCSLLPLAGHAGPFTDDLAKCLVKMTDAPDRELLIRWVFAAMSAHPNVKELSNVSFEKGDELNRDAAALFVKLLTQSCKQETKQALEYEGAGTFEASFQVLGEVAMQGLMAHPDVVTYLSGLEAHIDEGALEDAFGKPE